MVQGPLVSGEEEEEPAWACSAAEGERLSTQPAAPAAPQARWTKQVPGQAPPTAVLVHGILGRRQNMQSFARMLAQGFPAWQILLVDMRCHGESAGLANRPDGPHTVHSAAKDILLLLRELKLFPHVLIGHSFGGKVVMSMVEVFGTSQLPRPLQVRGRPGCTPHDPLQAMTGQSSCNDMAKLL
ncbi:predicted protein [Haematococcus lacustris]|uniref:AB hydrolase-1 domain-containing protein n=1 Tax=Haematococcus lacustris TaxID=44745 RepID=A0A699YY73_HAELA|nr:predicted protein [Haematococcus lacustris]